MWSRQPPQLLNGHRMACMGIVVQIEFKLIVLEWDSIECDLFEICMKCPYTRWPTSIEWYRWIEHMHPNHACSYTSTCTQRSHRLRDMHTHAHTHTVVSTPLSILQIHQNNKSSKHIYLSLGRASGHIQRVCVCVRVFVCKRTRKKEWRWTRERAQ